ncbi:unnamed protein product [Brachionus calyciflorus]|uniref:Uncharacterized protein n=1 Tax=Brachionus calyciflorus TaxID=104777 RepID=A0A814G622_9BILA|nr:unnamed protein product [Brachionus calyciflorus]
MNKHKLYCIDNDFYFFREQAKVEFWGVKDFSNSIAIHHKSVDLTEIPSKIVKLKQLKILIISSNRIEKLSNAAIFENLVAGIFENNQIESIHSECFGKCKNLKFLNFHKNMLKEIALVFDLEKSGYLNLNFSSNENLKNASFLIKKFGSNLSKFKGDFKLCALDFEPYLTLNNSPKLLEISYYFGQNPSKYLSIYERLTKKGSQLTFLEDTALNFLNSGFKINPHFLDIGNSQIDRHPILKNYSNLFNLNLSHNKINTISYDLYPKNIEFINLAYNLIENIPIDAFKLLENLVSLNLAHNKLKLIEEISFQSAHFKLLDLQSNFLENIKEIRFSSNKPLDDLRILLNFNRLEKLPNIFGNIKSIKELSITNQINLKSFNLDFSTIQSPSVRINTFNLSYNNLSRFTDDLFCFLKSKPNRTHLVLSQLDLRFNYLNTSRLKCLLSAQFKKSEVFDFKFNEQNFDGIETNNLVEQCSMNKNLDCEIVEYKIYQMFHKKSKSNIFDKFLGVFVALYFIFTGFLLKLLIKP